ncbi:MAG: undecaprenyldiphospho-muramoylpentapeptide beta-N-acetylglucosaminyltransferase [Lentimicrobiaceae bacterium]|nr:undecaprenyldiphospho-muramoylpentapeptide beta-N-acetylglucosaminyltransferase [Lentimicrobiaceae bacterium]
MSKTKRIIISGGGTGGHIFPAIAIANAVKEQMPDVEIRFVGANGRMEMQRIPEAGFQIEGLDMYGLQRKLTPKNVIENIKLPFRLRKSIRRAKQIIRDFQPDAVVGVGGYASYPTLRAAISLKIPTLIQEQNSYPGIANRLLAGKINKICTAYDNMAQFFPAEKTVKTGNPVRKDIVDLQHDRTAAYRFFELDSNKKTVAVIGGSLGSLTINESVAAFCKELKDKDIQLIWQTGEYYYKTSPNEYKEIQGVRIFPFISRMDLLYTAADVIVSRAGALSISELCIVGKPCILIPSPNVSEDHQTKNASVLSHAGAAVLIADSQAKEKLKNAVLELINNEKQCKEMSVNLKKLALPNAAKAIANEVAGLMSEPRFSQV